MIVMLSKLLQKLHQSINGLDDHHEEEVGNTWMSCARCGENISSLVDAIHVQVDDDIMFLCSDTCYQRYMKSKLGQQIRLATKMVQTMKQRESARALATP